ncbi:hypothetical protein GA0071314_2050 [Halomonas sp. HL-93]|nr:hypothetical protein GA0071314_2050 [Halomonas sp. HL-93]
MTKETLSIPPADEDRFDCVALEGVTSGSDSLRLPVAQQAVSSGNRLRFLKFRPFSFVR